jgi:hypothetical protein
MSDVRGSLLLALALFIAAPPVQSAQQHNYRPKDGYVPNETTAIRVAEAILLPIYGEKQINSEAPLTAKLGRDVWHVTGTLPAGREGGVAEVDISKETGEILRVTHGK